MLQTLFCILICLLSYLNSLKFIKSQSFLESPKTSIFLLFKNLYKLFPRKPLLPNIKTLTFYSPNLSNFEYILAKNKNELKLSVNIFVLDNINISKNPSITVSGVLFTL